MIRGNNRAGPGKTRVEVKVQPFRYSHDLQGIIRRQSHIEGKGHMEHKPDDKTSVRAEAIAAILGASAGSGIGWVLWLITANIAVAIGIAGPIAAITNSAIRKVLK